METLTANYLVKDSPSAVAILDANLCIIIHSDVWKRNFVKGNDTVIGESYYDVLPETPETLRNIFMDCLQGAENLNGGQKFLTQSGTIQWLSWKIKSWKNDTGEVGGLIVSIEDVTEDKRREELLLKAEQVARIGGWELDMTTNKLYWTEVTKEIHEVSEAYEPTIEHGINFYKEGQHREAISLLVSDAMANGTAWDTELIIVTAKDNELWVRAKGETEFIDGRCIRIYGTFQDIDDKKKNELNFLKASERLAIATKVANVGIWDYDLLQNKVVWDDNMYRLYGADKKDFEGEYETWQAGLHPKDKERGDQEIKMAITGEKEFDTEFRVIWPSGEIRHIKAIAITQRDAEGKAIKMIGTNWDITELKTAQLMLRKSEESFMGAFESSNIGMALVGLDGTWIKVNTSLCDSLGYSENNLLKMTFQDITHPEDLKKDLLLFKELIKGGRESYQIEKRYYHKNGQIVYAILAVTAVRNIDGELSHFISQILDISQRKSAEEKLNRMVDITTEQNESLLNFAHIVSHNLRSHSSNLTMLSGFLNTEENENERNNLVKMLGDASESLNETVLHLNEVVQVKVGALDKMKRVNLYKSIKNVKKNLGLLLKEKNTICTFNIPENLKVNAIPAYVDSILLNLFTNSIKYSSPERPPVIVISSQQLDDKTILTFSDNGLGIDLDRHGEKLFGMYKTFHRNKDAKGIGLFITKNQIEAMNGRIEVDSTVDVGTTFKLYFESITT